ncbi:prolyl oligopeptidase family serine peptidase [Gemmatimonas sp.]|uniref:S9 family peptidase n=1 Tax=Gemmatimonas sp. TaxID=1962908 RepID=UPI003565751A
MVRLTFSCHLSRPSATLAALLVGAPSAMVAQQAPAAQAPAAQAATKLPKGPRAMMLADWYRVVNVSSPAVSPDGKRVAMTVTKAVEAENKRHSEIWVVNTAGGEAQRWTSPSTESSNPRWSPDGKYLFFTSPRAGGHGSTWAIRLDQPSGEATQVSTYPNGSMPQSGAFAVFTEPARRDTMARTGANPFARMQPMAKPTFDAITRPVEPTRFDGRHVTDMSYKVNGVGFVPGRADARSWRPAQLWRQTVGDTAKQQLTTTLYSHRSPEVSPDGKWIAFVADARLRSDSAIDLERDSLARLPYNRARDEVDRNDNDLYVMASTGGTPRKVREWMGTESDITWSPDSKQLAFVGRPSRTKSARIYVVNATGGAPRNLLGDWQFEPGSLSWLTTGNLQFAADIGGRSAILRADMSGKSAPQELVGGRRQLRGASYDAAGKLLAYTATSMTKPSELFVATADGLGERQLTHFNDEVNQDVVWSDAERFTYKSVGNMEIEGWLMKPYGYSQGKKYPMVIYIHGGPHSAYGEGWFDEFQNLAAQGMFVLFTNPRGSSGYGADFTYSTRGRWGMEDYEDLMKSVDIVAARPDVDSTKMGATGGSYGGFMTTWMATKTDRFKAIQTDRTITDWTYWYGSSDAQGLTEFEFYGKPWDNQALYDTLSPIRYVQKVKTPMLLVQSEEDHRTPMGSAEIWYMSLKKQGVPVEMVRYPRSNHDLSRTGEPWLLVDRLGRIRQWFAFWLQGVKAGAAAN